MAACMMGCQVSVTGMTQLLLTLDILSYKLPLWAGAVGCRDGYSNTHRQDVGDKRQKASEKPTVPTNDA